MPDLDRRSFLASAALGALDPQPTPKTVTIRGRSGTSEIALTTTDRLAHAVHSITWNGQEFINSADHGRQLQSASNFDVGSAFTSETFNPTEAGSRKDHTGPTSSSKLLHMIYGPDWLQTTTQMAFWLQPAEKSEGNPAKNTVNLSNHLLTKRVKIVDGEIDYQVCFTVPLGEPHTYAQFETVTGYMPPAFERFRRYEPKTGELVALDDGPGETKYPVVLSTTDDRFAMGAYCFDLPCPQFPATGYGRFRFKEHRVVKWNCVYRIRDKAGFPAGEYRYRHRILIGDGVTVRNRLRELHGFK